MILDKIDKDDKVEIENSEKSNAIRNLNQFRARELDCKQSKLPLTLKSSKMFKGAVTV